MSQQNAALLQDHLHRFVKLDQQEREKELPILHKVAHELALKENLKFFNEPAHRADLTRARNVTLRTQFRSGSGRIVAKPWEGGHTVVVIDTAGNIITSFANEVGDVYKKDGNLFPYALMKAVMRLHLMLNHEASGMDRDQNFEYLRGLFPADQPIYMGEATGKLYLSWGRRFVIGVSGAPLSKEYLESLAPGMLRDGAEFVSGAADQAFAEVMARAIEHRELEATLFPEPDTFQWLRRAH